MIRKLISLISVAITLVLFAPIAAMSADRDVPLVMWSVRDRLLRDRTQVLNQRADLNQRILALRTIQTDIDKLLSSSGLCSERYAELDSARGQLALSLLNLQRRIDTLERYLIENNKDLANVDYHIQRYACMR